jgi:recombination protein RecR
MDSIQKLVDTFRRFPGIGPRQARRFAYFLLTRDDSYNATLSKLIAEVKKDVRKCSDCQRFTSINNSKSTLCDICSDSSRDRTVLTIVGADTDLESIEKSGFYKGYYFVLGGNLPILEPEPEKKIRVKELRSLIEKKAKAGLTEIILALNANTEGEHTADYVAGVIRGLHGSNVKITRLGRGLSTGTELEYVDGDTLKNALRHRE